VRTIDDDCEKLAQAGDVSLEVAQRVLAGKIESREAAQANTAVNATTRTVTNSVKRVLSRPHEIIAVRRARELEKQDEEKHR
jgi:hypothetical protein